jgi:hypothetical protein
MLLATLLATLLAWLLATLLSVLLAVRPGRLLALRLTMMSMWWALLLAM